MANDDIDMASFLQLPASLAVGQETLRNAQGSLPSQNRLPSALPALPDPTMLFQMSSSLVKIREEILQGMSNIESLREAVKAAGPDALPLPPLDEGFLLPLPGPPQPSHRHRPVPQKSAKDLSDVVRPLERPVPADDDEAEQSLEEILDMFKSRMASLDVLHAVKVELCGDGEALLLDLGKDLGSGWATLRNPAGSSARERRVARVAIFGPTTTRPSILAVPSQAPFNAISSHLSSLDLTLQQLLYRLPELPSLLKQPCFRCKRYLRLGVAPSVTGKLPDVPTESSDYDLSMEHNEGRWVIWHPACTS